MTTLLAIDPGLRHTGWASFNTRGLTGTIQAPRASGEFATTDELDPQSAVAAQRQSVARLLTIPPFPTPTVVWVEDFRARRATKMLRWQLMLVGGLVCLPVDVRLIDPSVWKPWIKKKANAKNVRDAVMKLCKFDEETKRGDHEIDAIGLGLYALSHQEPTTQEGQDA